MSTLAKFRMYRDATAADDVRPISFTEWWLGRLAGKLLVVTATMAQTRRDYTTLNHTLLSVWAGNQSSGGHLVGLLPPAELSRALKEDRLRIVVDEPAPTADTAS